jgi:putative nucleotidyltransferase with HDIG domain
LPTAGKEIVEGLYGEAQGFLSDAFASCRAGQPLAAERGIQSVRDFMKTPGGVEALLRLALDSKRSGAYPVSHSVNVAILSIQLGRKLRYGEKELEELGVAALFHDIGLSQLPEGLLEKSGSYTRAETELVRKHPSLGREILRRLGADFQIPSVVAHQHHERESGQGYPEGLKADEVHEYAKIVGLADVFEALIHSRPHRAAAPPFRAVQTILVEEKEAFSPRLCKALVGAVSFFPLYSYIRLNSNAIGQVMEVSDAFPLRPVVRLLVDPKGKRLAGGKVVDLREAPLLYVTDVLSEENLP